MNRGGIFGWIFGGAREKVISILHKMYKKITRFFYYIQDIVKKNFLRYKLCAHVKGYI